MMMMMMMMMLTESLSTINQSINIRLIKVVRRNVKQLKYWQCIHSIK